MFQTSPSAFRMLLKVLVVVVLVVSPLCAQKNKTNERKKRKQTAAKIELAFPPALPDGRKHVVLKTDALLLPPDTIHKDVAIAKHVPTVELMYLPGQGYAGNPWSVWGDGLAIGGKYYTAIGDHRAPAGNAFVFEYDPATKRFRELVNVKKILNLPDGHYVPGKIHSRLDLGSDGRIYFSTHRGSTRVTTDQYHYKGDWIIACDPKSGETEVIVQGPVPKHCIPTSILDPDRLVFYGGTAPGRNDDPAGIQFFAYDVKARKLLYSGPHGPARYLMHSTSTGCVYYTAGTEGKVNGPIMRFDPAKPGPPVKLSSSIGLRSATLETPDGNIYTVSEGRRGTKALLYRFNSKTETVEELGTAAVGTQNYITSIDAGPHGRYLYYVPGAHGGSETDGSPIIQFDVKTRRKKVIAFLHPLCLERFGCTLKGTFGSAVDPKGDKIYVTWNNSRGGRVWDSCLLTVVHIPEAERKP